MKVVAIPSRRESDCNGLANTVLYSLLEFQPELWGLPPFDDWVGNTLPIEPIHLRGSYVSGSLLEATGIREKKQKYKSGSTSKTLKQKPGLKKT